MAGVASVVVRRVVVGFVAVVAGSSLVGCFVAFAAGSSAVVDVLRFVAVAAGAAVVVADLLSIIGIVAVFLVDIGVVIAGGGGSRRRGGCAAGTEVGSGEAEPGAGPAGKGFRRRPIAPGGGGGTARCSAAGHVP